MEATPVKKEWAQMSVVERKAVKEADTLAAMAAVNTGQFPTGIEFSIGGKKYIARPQRVTDSGGVTYGLPPQATVAGKRNARFNKFSFTLLGSGAESTPMEFENENFDL